MIVLALHTTGRRAHGALLDGPNVMATASADQASSALPGLLERLLTTRRLSWSDVDLFAVARGPGSFTGIKVGLATIWGLARAIGRPAVGIGSLQALALAGLRTHYQGSGIPDLVEVTSVTTAYSGLSYGAVVRLTGPVTFPTAEVVEVPRVLTLAEARSLVLSAPDRLVVTDADGIGAIASGVRRVEGSADLAVAVGLISLSLGDRFQDAPLVAEYLRASPDKDW